MTEEYLVCRSGHHPFGIRCAIIEVILTLKSEEKNFATSLSYKDKDVPILNLLPLRPNHDEKNIETYAVVINGPKHSFAIMADQIVDQIPIHQDKINDNLECLAWIDAKTYVQLRRRRSNRLILLESIK